MRTLFALLPLLQSPSPAAPPALHLLLPQRGAIPVGASSSSVFLESVTARITLVDRVATTQIDFDLTNRTPYAQEAQILLPIPEAASVRSLEIEGSALRPELQVLPAAQARAAYEAIVRRSLDPGLLEFADQRTLRTSVFPVPPHARQRVRITYEHLARQEANRLDYELPRSDSAGQTAIPWKYQVHIKSTRAISTVWSPSHGMKVLQESPHFCFLESDAKAAHEPGRFQFSLLLADADLTATLFACPDPSTGGGWFLLLAGAPSSESSSDPAPVPRTVLFTLDRSGSMVGEKFDQAKEAVRQVVEALRPGEFFNVIDYSTDIASFAPQPVAKTPAAMGELRRYLEALTATGATNLHGALRTSLEQPPAPGSIPLLLFLTDGLPTVGPIDETSIRDLLKNRKDRPYRVFSFGVGHDVNAPLLDRLAADSRGVATYVHPKESVEARVGDVFRKLGAPVLTSPHLRTLDARGELSTRVVRDVYPAEIPDLYAGDQLVLLGRYLDGQPLRFRIEGERLGRIKQFEYAFDPAAATTHNSHVARLWASRKIAELVEEARQAGAHPGTPSKDPRLQEITQEIVGLSLRHGVLTEYTAFLAQEGSDLRDAANIQKQVRLALAGRAQGVRTGAGAVSQSLNLRDQRVARIRRDQRYLDGQMREVAIGGVQQMGDKTLFRQGVRWVDAELFTLATGRPASAPADREVVVGSAEYFQLAERLRTEGRQGVLGLVGEVRLWLDGKVIAVKPQE